jgi:pyruvate/2-oxoglutarate dehydrogenase complex dihydrolipoamide acyltransferase (E2) component
MALALAIAGIALSGCGKKSSNGAVASASSVPAAQGNWMGRDKVKDAIVLLNQGDSIKARQLLMAVLKKQPGDSVARQLISQIDSDPRVLLGTQNYAYTLKEGDTLSVLAQRFLGNPMMFFALARYNNIAIPTSVSPGQSILIPGKAPAPTPAATARKPAAKPAPADAKASAAAKPEAPAAKPAQHAANPALATKLRGQGLAAMNAGAINRAVALLRRALSLNPDSGVIKNDLARALRIQSTVQARP